MTSTWHPDQPYQALPDLPPGVELETTRVLKALVYARSELAALNESQHLVPNPAVLINAIPLLEAQSSSEIENIVTTTDELFRYSSIADKLHESPAAKETLRYRSALCAGFQSIRERPLSTNTAIEICSDIHGRPMTIRNLPGTKIANPGSGDIIYTPPEHEEVLKAKLANWERFLHGEMELDPLVRMAVAHYQFEAIHPFFDGNGRTGRIINILALVQLGLLELPILYLSRFILDNKAEYYRRLNAVTADDAWQDWTVFMLTAVAETSRWTRHRIHEIRDLQLEIAEEVKAQLPSVYRHELIEIIFEQPYCRIENVVAKGLATRQTASNWLNALADEGIVRAVTVGRTKLFINHRLFALLTNG